MIILILSCDSVVLTLFWFCAFLKYIELFWFTKLDYFSKRILHLIIPLLYTNVLSAIIIPSNTLISINIPNN